MHSTRLCTRSIICRRGKIHQPEILLSSGCVRQLLLEHLRVPEGTGGLMKIMRNTQRLADTQRCTMRRTRQAERRPPRAAPRSSPPERKRSYHTSMVGGRQVSSVRWLKAQPQHAGAAAE